MKKLMIACGVVAMTMFATSCKKEYTCTCTITDSSGNTPTQTVSGKTEKLKKSEAEDKCKEGNSSVGTFTTTCEID